MKTIIKKLIRKGTKPLLAKLLIIKILVKKPTKGGTPAIDKSATAKLNVRNPDADIDFNSLRVRKLPCIDLQIIRKQLKTAIL